jgi:hypothetical protein
LLAGVIITQSLPDQAFLAVIAKRFLKKKLSSFHQSTILFHPVTVTEHHLKQSWQEVTP